MALRLLHYSDVENAYDDPERIGRLAGGLQARRDADTLVCGTGDNTSPGVLSLVTEAEQSLDFFAAVDPDFDTYGNHDFDYGPDRAREIVDRAPQQWLSANVHAGPEDDAFGHAEGVAPWTTVQTDGRTVGLFGLTDPRTPSINPNATAVRFSDPIAAAENAVAELRAAGADTVIALSHLGADDEELAVAVDVDVILGGHVHSERIERVDDTLLTRPGVNGEVFLEVVLDDDGADVRRHVTADSPLDEAVAEALRERMREADLTEVVATVADPLERTQKTAFRGESRIGNFVADAYRWHTGADVGLQNSGGIREGDPVGPDVTVADLISVVPFKEPVAVAALTGAELLDVFRQASGANVAFGEAEWWHAHVSGAELVWDRDEKVIESATVGGDPVDPEGTYTLATTDYLFHTDHEFPTLDEPHRVDVGDVQYEVLVAYAREHGLDAAVEGRIVRNGTGAD